MKFIKVIFLLIISIFTFTASAQTAWVERVDPPNWWTGMKDNTVQLVFTGKNIKEATFELRSVFASITRVSYSDNPDYAFVDLLITKTEGPCTLNFMLKKGKIAQNFNFELKQRAMPGLAHQGFTHEDLIYLILPDRFSNGDTSNDVVKGMNEVRFSRDSMFYRHGGDIRGIIEKLDYLEDLGVTALWLNPVYENNQPFASYHGYAITDHYKVDPRLGTMQDYVTLVAECHKRGIKVIKDMVFNHVGNEHWFYKNKPFQDWTHEHDTFMFSNFRVTAWLDPYASDYDRNKMQFGWFDRHMPDLNHKNKFLSKYLIQNTVWWIETAGLNGIRFDTYAYSDLDFMAELGKKIILEYPQFNSVGEVWDNGVVIQAYFTQNNCNNKKLNTFLPATTDFQLYHAINNALNDDYGWNKGVERIYYTLCGDIAYKTPFNNLIFLDNHDLSRFFSVAGEDLKKFKMGIGFLFTTRGIPMLYYGTEILMKNYKGPDEKVREDFPGGWKDDKVNKFLPEYRSPQEQEAFEFVRTLARWRKTNDAVRIGKLKQFVPEAGVYVYFRYHNNQKVMVLMNTSTEMKNIDINRFKEVTGTSVKARDIVSGKFFDLNNLTVEEQAILILELL